MLSIIFTLDDCHECFFYVVAVEGRGLEVEELVLVRKFDDLLQFYASLLFLIAFVAYIEQTVPTKMQTMFSCVFSLSYLIHFGMFS